MNCGLKLKSFSCGTEGIVFQGESTAKGLDFPTQNLGTDLPVPKVLIGYPPFLIR